MLQILLVPAIKCIINTCLYNLTVQNQSLIQNMALKSIETVRDGTNIICIKAQKTQIDSLLMALLIQ